MSRVFITFLGIGNINTPEGKVGYDSLLYVFEDGRKIQTEFAQKATVEWIGVDNIDTYLVLLTEESYKKHWNFLLQEWKEIGVDESKIQQIFISTNQEKTEQWKWFQQLFIHIDVQDILYFDFTHGFRSVPILFSTAIAFLQKAKDVSLQHAFYGYMENRTQGCIIDLVDFYRINDWADGVNALVESADPSKLNRLAEREGQNSPFVGINNQRLIQALDTLNLRIRSVDVENVGSAAKLVCALITEQKRADGNTPDQFLLDMILQKFLPLTQEISKEYDQRYFALQCSVISVLIEHQFLMQAITAMRELIGTMGLVGLDGVKKQNKEWHRAHADVFFHMCQYKQNEWKFTDKTQVRYERLLPVWEKWTPEQQNTVHAIAVDISKIRNGFDHAWLGTNGVPQDVQQNCVALFGRLQNAIKSIIS